MRVQVLAQNMEGDLGTMLLMFSGFSVRFQFGKLRDYVEVFLYKNDKMYNATLTYECFPALMVWLQEAPRMDATVFRAKIQELNEPYIKQLDSIVITSPVAV